MPRLAPPLLLASHLALIAGCPREEIGTPAPSESSPTDATADLREEAQKEALQRLAPKVVTLSALEDPVTTAFRDGTAPRMPPLGAAARQELRTALDDAELESKGLTPRLLEPADRTVAIAAVFAINRARDHYVRRAPWLDDPTWITREVALVVGELEASARAEGACTHCAASLADVRVTLEAAANVVRETSMPRARAAAEDARALALRVRALPSPDEATATALEAFATEMDGVTTTSAPRWDAKALQRVLEVEENVPDKPVDAFKSLGAAVKTLSSMSGKRPAPQTQPPTPLTAARCEAAWADIQKVIARQEALDAGEFSCSRFVAGAGGSAFDDAGLRIALVDIALVRPQRRAAQNAFPPVLSGIGGRIPRGAQAHTLRTALLMGEPALSDAAGRALQAELDAACLAAAALWIHGGLGEDEALGERLDPLCPEKTPSYIRRAESRPRQALEGLALARVPMGPAGVVPLDKLWWLPMGLLEQVAKPPGEEPPPAPVEAKIERLEPQKPGTEDPAP